MFVNVNPEPASAYESLCSLKFAAKVNGCEQGQTGRSGGGAPSGAGRRPQLPTSSGSQSAAPAPSMMLEDAKRLSLPGAARVLGGGAAAAAGSSDAAAKRVSLYGGPGAAAVAGGGNSQGVGSKRPLPAPTGGSGAAGGPGQQPSQQGAKRLKN